MAPRVKNQYELDCGGVVLQSNFFFALLYPDDSNRVPIRTEHANITTMPAVSSTSNLTPKIILCIVILINLVAIYSLVKSLGWRSATFWSLGCLGFSAASFIPLMGLPGGLAMLPGEIWSHLFLKESVGEVFSGDKAWPAALIVTGLMNSMLIPCLAIAVLLVGPIAGWSRWGVLLGVYSFWASWCPLFAILLDRAGHL